MVEREQSTLTIVTPRPDATVIRTKDAPAGKGLMDLLCGSCGAVLVRGQTASEVAAQYKALELVIECACGARNLLAPGSMQ